MGVASKDLTEAFARRWGRADGVRVYRGPGRVNLIGEHTDYNLGFVLPMALEMAAFIAAAPNSSGRIRVHSENLNQTAERPAAGLAEATPAHDWSDYVFGVAQQLVRAGFEVTGADLYIRSTVPLGSGLSSSAALETSTALALLGGREMDRLELVKLCRRAENEFAGMPCGIMDQYISVFGRAGAAVKIDCRSLEHEIVPLPADVVVYAVNTMVEHELGASEYPNRVRECREAAEALGVASLRDATMEQFETMQDSMAPVPRKRARHIISENARVEAFMMAARAGDLRRMGELFVASHRSLAQDYEVSCEELDFLVESALAIEGVYGARMTGGGFGGCTVNLVRPDAAERFREEFAARYRQRFAIEPQIYECHPSDGAGEVDG